MIFKIDHPNAESVEIHLELLVFDLCWGCQQVFGEVFVFNQIGAISHWLCWVLGTPGSSGGSKQAWKIGGKECPPYHHGPPLPTSTRNSWAYDQGLVDQPPLVSRKTWLMFLVGVVD